ncbi:MAG: 6-bladed beta-propeller [Acetobacteraceae bacterium]|jgi:DNA-binding beta-propeller fold protein YncE
MTRVGTGDYTYELIPDFLKLPNGEKFGLVSRVGTDSRDRVYVFQRKDPPVVVFDRDGTWLGSWGTGEVTDPHGLKIVNDIVYTTDRSDSVAKSFTLDGKVLLTLGQRGVHSDTGCTGAPWLAQRAAGPFNHPTEMIAHPNGDIYVTDGYRNARVHRFTRDGKLVTSWGTPGHAEGQFHLPHSIAIDDDGKLYVADRANRRIQIFTPDGAFLGQWTGMGGPNDITRGPNGTFTIAEQEADGNPAYVTVRDAKGAVLVRMESRHVHGVGVDSRGDIYAGLTQNRSVDKFVRQH